MDNTQTPIHHIPSVDKQFSSDEFFTKHELQQKICQAKHDMQRYQDMLDLYVQKSNLEKRIQMTKDELQDLQLELKSICKKVETHQKTPQTFTDTLRNYAPPVVNKAMDYVPAPVYTTVNKAMDYVPAPVCQTASKLSHEYDKYFH